MPNYKRNKHNFFLPSLPVFLQRVSRENLITLGKYAIKLGLAGTLAAVIAEKLHLKYPIYALIAPIIIMGTTRGSTWTAAIDRIKGTIIGTIAGAIFESIFGSNPYSLLAASTFFAHTT